MPDKSPFPSFLAWCIANARTMTPIHAATLNRYTSGAVPQPLLWFLENPGALAALAEDAATLTPEDIARFREMIGERSQAQREYREKNKAKAAEGPNAPKGKRKR